jgi:ribulose-phosphate 3-epimerase
MPDMLKKVSALRATIKAKNYESWIQLDGGVNADNIAAAAAAGADSLVAGSAVFGAKDVGAAFRDLESKARASFKF